MLSSNMAQYKDTEYFVVVSKYISFIELSSNCGNVMSEIALAKSLVQVENLLQIYNVFFEIFSTTLQHLFLKAKRACALTR